jgi:hypothetical protein
MSLCMWDGIIGGCQHTVDVMETRAVQCGTIIWFIVDARRKYAR